MDGSNFDRFTQGLATASSRRSFLKGIVASALATGFGSLRPGQSDAAACKSVGKVCREHGNCCSGLCGDKDRTGRRKCVCPAGLEEKKGQCVDPKTAYLADIDNCGAAGVKCPHTKCQVAVCTGGTCGLAPNAAAVSRSCDDGKAWTTKDVCQADGSCAGTLTPCDPPDQCHETGVRDRATGVCSYAPKPNGASCNDGNACTQTDACQDGVCVGGNPVVCTASDSCHEVGTCDPKTGQCSNPVKPNGTSCSDNNACTDTDTCQEGVCTSGTSVTCNSPGPCQVEGSGVCNEAKGQCEYTTQGDGSPCEDGNLCTRDDTCQAGVCVGGNLVVCTASDSCHEGGACDPQTGVCSNPAKTDGGPCGGGVCTTEGTCQAGTCTGGTAVVCDTPGPCQEGPGTCNPTTGECEYATKADGSTCDDGDPCSTMSLCHQGTCYAVLLVNCTTPPSPCHERVGTCNASTGQCDYQVKSDGAPCDTGKTCTTGETCQSGVCTGGSPVVCTALDDCHVPGICNPQTGCSNPRAANETPCDDGNPLCVNGTCCASCCQVYDNLLNPESGHLVQCTAGQTCQPLDLSSIMGSSAPPNAGICCAGGGVSCLDWDPVAGTLDALCCDSGETCQSTMLFGNPYYVCCAGEVCPTTASRVGSTSPELLCCGGDTGCVTRTVRGLALSLCCPEQSEICVTEIENWPPVYGCCTGTCQSVGAPYDLDICCPAGKIPLPVIGSGFSGTIVCVDECATEFCYGQGAGIGGGEPVCCPAGTSCLPAGFSQAWPGISEQGICCASADRICHSVSSSGLSGEVCCDVDCQPLSVGGTTANVCCPEGTVPTMDLATARLMCVNSTNYCPTYFPGVPYAMWQQCPQGTICSPVELTGYGNSGTVKTGACCPPGQGVAYIDGEFGCCPSNQRCGSIQGMPICCETGETCAGGLCLNIEHPPTCSAGQELVYDPAVEAVCCDSTQVCPLFGVNLCCPSGTSCERISACPAGITCPNDLYGCFPECPTGKGIAVDPATKTAICCDEANRCGLPVIPGLSICCPSQASCNDFSCLSSLIVDIDELWEQILRGVDNQSGSLFPFPLG
jgi:hypothetical protein